MNDHDRVDQKAYASAIKYLSYRSRTEAELRQHLLPRFSEPAIDEVVARLKSQTLLDDSKFAGQWTESRSANKPRSAAMIRHELVRRGVESTAASSAVTDVDDEDGAYRAGLKHLSHVTCADSTTFRRRMWAYLKRRGFTDALSRKTIDRLWEEVGD